VKFRWHTEVLIARHWNQRRARTHSFDKGCLLDEEKLRQTLSAEDQPCFTSLGPLAVLCRQIRLYSLLQPFIQTHLGFESKLLLCLGGVKLSSGLAIRS